MFTPLITVVSLPFIALCLSLTHPGVHAGTHGTTWSRRVPKAQDAKLYLQEDEPLAKPKCRVAAVKITTPCDSETLNSLFIRKNRRILHIRRLITATKLNPLLFY